MRKIINRVLLESDYIIKTNMTVREVALLFNVSKSTVHKDITERLLDIDINKYKLVREVLDNHRDIRHIRGGESTKKIYLNKRKVSI